MGFTFPRVAFGLRMHGRGRRKPRCGGLKDFGFYPLGQSQHVDGAHDAPVLTVFTGLYW